MPELPDVTVYQERLLAKLRDEVIIGTRLFSLFVLRSVEPPITVLQGRSLQGVERMGKRLVFDFGDELFLVLHLMIAGRLRWRRPGARPPGKMGLAAFDFAPGTLMLTEAASKKRASLHVVRGRAGLAEFDRGGLEVMDSTVADFAAALRRENRTLKRALTDPTILSGIGNAYSDEILHAARMSPLQLSRRLDDAAMARLHAATLTTLRDWTERLRAEVGAGFPEEVTAFRPGMAVHGRFKQPCPVCETPVQHILYASNECNYCPTCQTEGRLLADRGLSQLMRKDWPKTLEELEERKGQR
jgi:formamidopyrimidine-DNA glycosylase